MPKTSPFGEWLRKWRKARKLTQVQLARMADCAQSTISEHERGIKQEKGGDYMLPEPDLVERLATALGRPVEEARALAGYNPSPVPVTVKTLEQAREELDRDGISLIYNPTGLQLNRESARLIAEELAKLLQQPHTENVTDK